MATTLVWARPPTSGTGPCPRGGHTGALVGNLLIVFGGTYYEGGGSNKFVYLKDLWALETDTLRWYRPKLSGTGGPGARHGHGAVVVGAKMYVFGGKGEGGLVYNDLWVLDVEAWTWTLEAATLTVSAPPSPRFGHAMVAVKG